MAEALGFDVDDIIVDERLYAASADEVLRVIGELDNDVGTAMVVGHNPETASLAHRFSERFGEMPTCAVAEFTFDVDGWYELEDAEPKSVAWRRRARRTASVVGGRRCARTRPPQRCGCTIHPQKMAADLRFRRRSDVGGSCFA